MGILYGGSRFDLDEKRRPKGKFENMQVGYLPKIKGPDVQIFAVHFAL
jgi:hypothetical protein